MKVTRLRPIPSARLLVRTAGCVLATVETDAGLVGEGPCFSLNGRRLDVLLAMVRSFEDLVVGAEAGGDVLQRAEAAAVLARGFRALKMSQGWALAPDRPGWGFSFDPAAVARFAA